MTFLLLARLAYIHWWNGSIAARELRLSEGNYSVVSVVRGDTLTVRPQSTEMPGSALDQPVRVRLLGVDCGGTSELDTSTPRCAVEALAFTRSFVAGQAVRLQFDKRRIDQQGCYLAYAYVDDQSLNEALVQAGLARVTTYPGDSLSVARRLRLAEQEARDQMRGIWSGEH